MTKERLKSGQEGESATIAFLKKEETRLKSGLANSEKNWPQNLQLFGNSSIYMKNRALSLYEQNNRLG